MSGLYSKANQILNNNNELHALSDANSDLISFDSTSGISQDDQKEIIRNINQIMQSSKIKASPDIFRIKAKKKGIGLPFFINLTALILTAAVILWLWAAFRQEETNIASGAGGGSEAQRQILEMQKQRAAEELNKKNREIESIQSDLQKLNTDLQSLKENLSNEVAAREKAMREKYDAELEAERKKLVAAGTSATDIERRLKALGEEQNRRLQIEIDSFRRDAEAKMQERERALMEQQREFNARLEAATQDRQRLSAAYEAELRRSEEQLGEAERKNRALTAQKEKFDLIDRQIIGFYGLVQADIGAGKNDSARKRLQELKEYLAQPGIAAIPEIARRSELEAFVIGSLESLIASREAAARSPEPTPAAPTPTTSAADAQAQAEAKIITDIRALVLQADEAFRAGDKTRADGLYLKALELIPEINKSHRFLMGRVNEIEAYRKAQVAAALDAAALQFRNRRYSEALASYGKALEYLPTDRATAQVLNEMKTAAFEAENERLNAQTIKAADEKLKAGNERFTKGAYDEAIALYLELLRTSSRAPAGTEAAARLSKAVSLKDEAFSRQIAALQGASSSGLDEYKKEIEVLKKTVAEREKELAALKKALEGKDDDLAKQLAAEKEQRRAAETEIERLKTLSEDYVKLKTEYGTYARNEDGVVRARTLEEMALGKSYLDSFLSSKTVQSAFPGILERIKRYDRAFERAGRNSALADMRDVITAVNALKTKAEKISFLQKKAAEAEKSDPMTSVLLKSLIELIST